MKPSTEPQAASLHELFDANVRLTHRLARFAEEVHGEGVLTASRRGVLRGLLRGGPQTVPEMARARPVSRQHVQSLVNGLRAHGLVALVDNPAHKRSKLVRLTPEGRKAISDMLAREAAVLDGLELEVSREDIEGATRVLRSLRESFERLPEEAGRSKQGNPEGPRGRGVSR